MPQIDPRNVEWDEEPIRPENVQWEGGQQQSPPSAPEQDESFSLKTMIENIPSDAWETAKQTVYPLTNTREFIYGLSTLLENPEARKQVWTELKNKYSDPTKYVQEHPVQAVMDLSTILSGVGLLGKVGTLGKVGEVAATVGKAGEAIHPLSVAALPTKVTRKVASAMGAPEKLYERAMKVPPGSLRESGRERVFKTMIEERLPVTPKSLREMSERIGKLDQDISNELWRLSNRGADVDISVVVRKLQRLKEKYRNRPDPKPYLETIDDVSKTFAEHAFQNNGRISLSKAQELKKGTYQEIESYYKKGQKPETGRTGISSDVEAKAKAEAASALRQAIEDSPEIPKVIRQSMKRENELMNARRWVERATNRGGNLDVVNLSGMLFGVLVEKGVPGAIAWRIAGLQSTQSRLALLIAKGSKNLRRAGKIMKPTTLGTFQAGRLVAPEEEIMPEE